MIAQMHFQQQQARRDLRRSYWSRTRVHNDPMTQVVQQVGLAVVMLVGKPVAETPTVETPWQNHTRQRDSL